MEIAPVYSLVLGMLVTTGHVEINVCTSQSSARNMQILAQLVTMLVVRRIMQDVLMVRRVRDILNVETDASGPVPGLSITTYLVQISACTGKLERNLSTFYFTILEKMLRIFMNVTGHASLQFIHAMENANLDTHFVRRVVTSRVRDHLV